MVTLKSTVKRMQSFNLPHDPCCASECVCVDTIFTAHDHNSKTGLIGIRRLARKISPSISVAAMATVLDLPDAVLEAPEVKAALGKSLVVASEMPMAPEPIAFEEEIVE